MGHKILTSPRMSDSRLLLPFPVLPQTPSMVPCKAKEDRPGVGTDDSPRAGLLSEHKMTNRKQNTHMHPQGPSDKQSSRGAQRLVCTRGMGQLQRKEIAWEWRRGIMDRWSCQARNPNSRSASVLFYVPGQVT